MQHLHVTDTASHRRDQIANFAELLKKAPSRQKVFSAIYRGKKKAKTVSEIARVTGFSDKRVTMIAKPLVREKLFSQDRARLNGRIQTLYIKSEFVESNKKKILRLAGDTCALENFHTKTNPRSVGRTTIIKVPFTPKVRYLTIDDVDQFRNVKGVSAGSLYNPKRLPEAKMKRGLIRLLGERKIPKDWGGEINDVFTTQLKVNGKRLRAAFALKGPAKKGPLTPTMMGKNGDQIQRLFSSPSDAFFVQYEGEIRQNVVELMEQLARARAVLGQNVYFGVINEADTQRLRAAYPEHFD
jgi:hypothetical protein